MNVQTASDAQSTGLGKYGWNGVARFLFLPIVYGVLLFVGAGTLNWALGWGTAVAYFVGWLITVILLIRHNPDLLIARGQPTKKSMSSGTKSRDWIFLSLYFLMTLVEPLVSGLDYRNGWSGIVSPIIPIIGFLLLIPGFWLTAWPMTVNRYFEGTVRIQEERHQHVISTGPYRYLRHPGYAGVILYSFGTALAAGTLVALIPAAITAIIFIFRTAFEDRTLQAELPGYKEFAQRTKYRLLPGVW